MRILSGLLCLYVYSLVVVIVHFANNKMAKNAFRLLRAVLVLYSYSFLMNEVI